ncbi:MAG: hypothetical protein ACFB14_06595 [Leptolyngbyaceae cyanobacterium]|mgnify:FL=1
MPSTHSSWFAHQLQGLINRSRAMPAHRFVLFGAGFSGAHIAIDLLRQEAIDTCHGPLPPTWTVEPLLNQRHFFPLQYVQCCGLSCSSYLFGFKLSAADLIVTHGMSEPYRFMGILHRQGYRVIHLQRLDLMRHAIAVLKAQQPTSRQVDPQALLATLKQLDEQRIAEAAIVSQVPHLSLTYETDLIDPNVHSTTAQRLCRFLSLQHRPSSRPAMKLVHQRVSDLIDNYDEVCTVLKRSDYAYVLTAASAKLAI